MKNTLFIMIVLANAFLSGQNKIESFNMNSKPTKWEFEVNKYTWNLLWKANPGIEIENEIKEYAAKKYSTTTVHVEKILIKLQYYNNVQNPFTGKLVEDMTWTEFEKLIKKFGAPWPNEKKKRLVKKTQN
ncbi:MAG: hypothetical protein SCARUB_04321 [Candidatus Scalindua rubra]|uniref:Uncharacterized protein n=1 Tax=Candidatus Scalindua rubra TaxID=1872076 RepID=A0A1E3X4H0_9BACT|nr:MAG: hypothetical protein SCARUB_04321 [Candidatus Scalindua rubra]